MSDLCLYELEDNVWDEFGESDDHIVPHPGNKHADQSLTEGDIHKKPQSEVIAVTSNADTSTKYIRGKGKRSVPTVTNSNTMLEKGSWSDTRDGVFPSCDTDSTKEVTSLASDCTRISNHSFKSGNVESGGSEFRVDDSIMVDGCTAVDNSLYRYPLSRMPQTGNELSYFDNDREDRENVDLLYYGWPDIGNFEDVDRMFRSCDSTFGMDSLNNDEELSWFSSSNATEGSEDALKSGLKFSGPNAGSSKGVSENYDDFKPGIEQQKMNAGPNSMSYIQRQLPSMNLEHTRHSDQISVFPTPSSMQSEKDGRSSSLKESSYASNQLQSMESSHGPSTETPLATTSENREKPNSCQGFQSSFIMNFENAATTNPMVFGGTVSNQKQVQKSENQIGGHSDVEGASNEIPAEFDSSNLQESSCMSSVLDNISLEATSFLQLQQVMEKLDVRTKLCIRDSLYRLARSAEQRHNCANQRGGIRDNGDASGALMVEETNKCTGFIDMETNTNPIDRSIAHLLFHRPSDSSRLPSNNSLSLRSHALIRESVSSPPVRAEKQVCQDETIADGEEETLITNDG